MGTLIVFIICVTILAVYLMYLLSKAKEVHHHRKEERVLMKLRHIQHREIVKLRVKHGDLVNGDY